jgi:cell division protein FtsB
MYYVFHKDGSLFKRFDSAQDVSLYFKETITSIKACIKELRAIKGKFLVSRSSDFLDIKEKLDAQQQKTAKPKKTLRQQVEELDDALQFLSELNDY